MIMIEKLGLGRRTSARAERHDFKDAYMTSLGNRQHISRLDLPTGSGNLVLVHANIACGYKFGGQASGLGDPGKPEPLVYAQFGTFFAHHSPNKKARRKAAL